MNDPRLSQISATERDQGGQTVKYTDSKRVNIVFREECENRFSLTRKVLITDDELKILVDIGKTDMSLAKDIFEGRIALPEDMDQSTRMMIEEIIATVQGNKRNFQDKPEITASEFVVFWSKISENTQSYVSTLNYRSI